MRFSLLPVGRFAMAACFTLMLSPALAALSGDRLVCTVSPAWAGRAAMPLRIWITPAKMHVVLPIEPKPVEAIWEILENNDVGIVAASGTALTPPGAASVVNGSMIFVERRSGAIRWTESGVDNLAVVDRAGYCSADTPG